MSSDTRPPDHQSVFAALADRRRRLAAVALHEQSRPLPAEDLARLLAARETGREPGRVPEETHSRVAESLHHVHLPKLVTAGVVRREDGAVALASSPFADRAVELALATTGPDAESHEDPSTVFSALADRTRATAVAVLRSAEDARRLSVLADRVAAAVAPAVSAVRIAVSLDHVHLPKLDDAGVVTYDRPEKRATFDGLPEPFDRALTEPDRAADRSQGSLGTGGDSLSTSQ